MVSDRSEPTRMERYFVLPPHMEHYYQQQHPEYIQLPEATTTVGTEVKDVFHFVYPSEGSVISLTKQMDGTYGSVVCKLVHTISDAEIFWHLDDSYIGSTTNVHDMQISPSIGYHTLTAVDIYGNWQAINIIVR